MARFITFEGIEGAGKSLQISLLAEELRGRGIPFVLTREPGGTELGQELRKVLLHRDGAIREPVSELLLYLADRCQHLKQVIEPALAAGQLVLCDRYHDATVVYQGYARNLGEGRVEVLRKLLEIRPPDLTLWLDIEVEDGLRRARRRAEGEGDVLSRFEMEALAFHQKVREGYLKLAKANPRRIRRIDASGTPDQVFAKVRAVLLETGVLN